MSNYVKATDFASKDDLLTGDPLKIIKGQEIDDEFNSIQTAVNSKANANDAALTGTPTAPTATTNTNTTQIATTAFVVSQIADDAPTKTGTGASGNWNIGASSLVTTNWTVTESGGVLYFAYDGTNKAKLDSSGNLTVVGNVTAYGTV